MKSDFKFLHQYLQTVTPPRPAVLKEMERLAEKEDFPIIGPLVGRFLYQLVKLTGAKKVFELGSGYGYSAMWIALALPKTGRVYCTDGEVFKHPHDPDSRGVITYTKMIYSDKRLFSSIMPIRDGISISIKL